MRESDVSAGDAVSGGFKPGTPPLEAKHYRGVVVLAFSVWHPGQKVVCL
jgi:hypothetical protein